MQDKVEHIVELLNSQLDRIRKLKGLVEEGYGFARKRDIDSVFPVLFRQKDIFQEYRSVNEQVKQIFISMGFESLEELISSESIPDDQRRVLKDILQRLRGFTKDVVSIQDKTIDLLKESKNSIKKELDDLNRGRKIIEGYYKTSKGIEPRFFDKKR